MRTLAPDQTVVLTVPPTKLGWTDYGHASDKDVGGEHKLEQCKRGRRNPAALNRARKRHTDVACCPNIRVDSISSVAHTLHAETESIDCPISFELTGRHDFQAWKVGILGGWH